MQTGRAEIEQGGDNAAGGDIGGAWFAGGGAWMA